MTFKALHSSHFLFLSTFPLLILSFSFIWCNNPHMSCCMTCCCDHIGSLLTGKMILCWFKRNILQCLGFEVLKLLFCAISLFFTPILQEKKAKKKSKKRERKESESDSSSSSECKSKRRRQEHERDRDDKKKKKHKKHKSHKHSWDKHRGKVVGSRLRERLPALISKPSFTVCQVQNLKGSAVNTNMW